VLPVLQLPLRVLELPRAHRRALCRGQAPRARVQGANEHVGDRRALALQPDVDRVDLRLHSCEAGMIWAEMGTTGTTIGVAGRRYLVARDDVAGERDLAGVAVPLPEREAWGGAGPAGGLIPSPSDETER